MNILSVPFHMILRLKCLFGNRPLINLTKLIMALSYNDFCYLLYYKYSLKTCILRYIYTFQNMKDHLNINLLASFQDNLTNMKHIKHKIQKAPEFYKH